MLIGNWWGIWFGHKVSPIGRPPMGRPCTDRVRPPSPTPTPAATRTFPFRAPTPPPPNPPPCAHGLTPPLSRSQPCPSRPTPPAPGLGPLPPLRRHFDRAEPWCLPRARSLAGISRPPTPPLDLQSPSPPPPQNHNPQAGCICEKPRANTPPASTAVWAGRQWVQ